jgi:hypothetical protein
MTSSPAPKFRVPILLPGPNHSSQPSTSVKRAYLGLLFWLIQTQPLHSPWSWTLHPPPWVPCRGREWKRKVPDLWANRQDVYAVPLARYTNYIRWYEC